MYSENFEPGQIAQEDPLGLLRVDRASILNQLSKSAVFDFVIVGGGIHGACFARLAAFNNFRTLLLEKNDYASATSSRSSKMAHGGLRYLEMYDFRQVFDGIYSREDLYCTAPHLVRPENFLFPILDQSKFKLKIGFWLYDLFLSNKSRKARLAEPSEIPSNLLNQAFCKDFFVYNDGIMRDTRLVIENIIAARQEGACCLNYSRVDSIYHHQSGRVKVAFTDTLSNRKIEVDTGLVINCCGPWVSQLGRLNTANFKYNLRFSQGSHLLFNVPWKNPALILPKEKRGEYYFVWPHFTGTLVGTTEREVEALEQDPLPFKEEVDELLARLAKDLPHANLNRDTLHYCYAGVRTLVAADRAKATSEISRRPVWSYGQGMLSLLGGKFTTASKTAFEGLKMAVKLAGVQRTICSLAARKLPGAGTDVQPFIKLAQQQNLNPVLVQAVLSRYGGLTKYFTSNNQQLIALANIALQQEVEFACDVEQAECLEDIMRRRLELEMLPEHGLKILPEVLAKLALKRPNLDIKAEESLYRQRMQKIDAFKV